MRTTTLFTSLGLALTLGAGIAAAQAPTQAPDHGRAEHAQGHRRGERGPDAFLLKGITLSADQQARVADLQKQWRAERPNGARQHGADRDSAQAGQRAERTPAQRAAMRQQMQQRLEQHASALRAVLTPDQQRTFDANLAQMKQRFAQRAEGGRNGGLRHNGVGSR